uniref:Uncharacterized protein n=1 Tax=Chromera velia CCMP2878 TaxID=1169474 RepID=A0A0G4HR49_9ALVE|eukprot:Cvel_8078.t1-p1 / transcript=Cvel_8078.t1 / gene=Cvel_8078 / organism=Chromera_velia_CCMP2878 / gene_product=hypothetical protein / transcript_product=hypothetical protein / location=Cvel_scaffold438:14636-21157(+) / protein_length=204 / sequence_SO=supercontig / SO=protein_coding / is_pseudo=false
MTLYTRPRKPYCWPEGLFERTSLEGSFSKGREPASSLSLSAAAAAAAPPDAFAASATALHKGPPLPNGICEGTTRSFATASSTSSTAFSPSSSFGPEARNATPPSTTSNPTPTTTYLPHALLRKDYPPLVLRPLHRLAGPGLPLALRRVRRLNVFFCCEACVAFGTVSHAFHAECLCSCGVRLGKKGEGKKGRERKKRFGCFSV